MGYDTSFWGELDIEPALTAEQIATINTIAKSDLQPDLEDCPDSYLQWIITADGHQLEWDQSEKFYLYVEWLEYLIERYFKPWGCVLEGSIGWLGEDDNDRGIIYVKDNVIEYVSDEITNPGPSWDRQASPLTESAPELLDCLCWAIRQFQGDSGTGHTHWEQYQPYLDALRLIKKCGRGDDVALPPEHTCGTCGTPCDEESVTCPACDGGAE